MLVPEVRWNRNYLRVNDTVRLLAGIGNARGVDVKVRRIEVDPADPTTIISVEVWTGDKIRVVRPERIRRLAQSVVKRKRGESS